MGDASTVEVEADTVLEREESDDNPDEAEELRVDSDMEKPRMIMLRPRSRRR